MDGNEEILQASAGKPVAGGADAAHIEKIRGILFGPQMRDYERRFTRLEDRLRQETADLRDEQKKRFDTLEAYVRSEVDSISERLATEHAERDSSMKGLSAELKELGRSLQEKARQLEEQAAKSQREQRQHVLEESKSLAEEIRRRHQDVSVLLEREIEQLRVHKADRDALASLFTEVAMRLSHEFSLPESE
jgi:Skp family chaperone for outer membrane proteins